MHFWAALYWLVLDVRVVVVGQHQRPLIQRLFLVIRPLLRLRQLNRWGWDVITSIIRFAWGITSNTKQRIQLHLVYPDPLTTRLMFVVLRRPPYILQVPLNVLRGLREGLFKAMLNTVVLAVLLRLPDM